VEENGNPISGPGSRGFLNEISNQLIPIQGQLTNLGEWTPVVSSSRSTFPLPPPDTETHKDKSN